MCSSVLCIGAVVEDFNCNEACNGTCVGNLVKCYCETSTPQLNWDITTFNGTRIERFEFIGDDNCAIKGGFQATYDNMLNSSNLTFTVNETAALRIKCSNGLNPGSKNCTVKDPGTYYIYIYIYIYIYMYICIYINFGEQYKNKLY